jgi:hypothetical protein
MPAPALIAFPPPAVRHNEPQSSSRVCNAPAFPQCRQWVRKRAKGETAHDGVEALGSHRQLLSVHAHEEDRRPGPGVRSRIYAAEHRLRQVNADRQAPSPDGFGGGHEGRAGAAGQIHDTSALGDPDPINKPTAEVTEEVGSHRPIGACRPVEDVSPGRRLVSVHSPILTSSRPRDDGAHLGRYGRVSALHSEEAPGPGHTLGFVLVVVREVETRAAVSVGPVAGDDGAVLVDDPVRTPTAPGGPTPSRWQLRFLKRRGRLPA